MNRELDCLFVLTLSNLLANVPVGITREPMAHPVEVYGTHERSAIVVSLDACRQSSVAKKRRRIVPFLKRRPRLPGHFRQVAIAGPNSRNDLFVGRCPVGS